MVLKAPCVAHTERREALIDEHSWARDDPLDAQAAESLYLHHGVDARFHLHKESYQQKRLGAAT